jgi:23S rRNA (cytidine1920-2'-O)/16S rRNA (cytidine1409-2'-O)-methyltransferase
MTSEQKQYVSRAGQKLDHALTHFNINVEGLICADFGSSTGGFVDCLLKRDAKRVYSVDVSYGELAWTLRNDSRVVVLERTNALHVELPEKVDFISADVGFTRQELVLPSCLKNIKPGGTIVSLLKPHYEAQKHQLAKGKLQDESIQQVVDGVLMKIKNMPGIEVKDIVESPIKGERGGNTEFLLFIMAL